MPFACDDGTVNKEDSALWTWANGAVDAAAKIGREAGTPEKYKGMLEAVGFTDVTEKVYKWPFNSWPKDPKLKELGKWNFLNADLGVEALCMALFTRVLGWSEREVQVLCAKVRKELRDPKIHAYWNM